MEWSVSVIYRSAINWLADNRPKTTQHHIYTYTRVHWLLIRTLINLTAIRVCILCLALSQSYQPPPHITSTSTTASTSSSSSLCSSVSIIFIVIWPSMEEMIMNEWIIGNKLYSSETSREQQTISPSSDTRHGEYWHTIKVEYKFNWKANNLLQQQQPAQDRSIELAGNIFPCNIHIYIQIIEFKLQ